MKKSWSENTGSCLKKSKNTYTGVSRWKNMPSIDKRE